MSEMNTNAMANGIPEEPKQKKNVGYRLFAVVLLALCALAVAVIPYGTVISGTESATLVDLLTGILASTAAPIFGVIPAYDVAGTLGIVYNLSIYLFLVFAAIAAILALVAIFTAKGAPSLVRTALSSLAAGALIYAVAIAVASEPSATLSVELMSTAVLAVAAVLATLLSIPKVGKVAWMNLIHFVLTVAFAIAITFPIAGSDILTAENADTLNKAIFLVAIVYAMLNCVISVYSIAKDGGLVCNLVRSIIALLVALATIYVVNLTAAEGESKLLYAIIAAVVALVQIIIVIVQIVRAANKSKEEAVEEATQEATKGFHTEEYAEAYAYEGGPVAGVLMAQEVNPSFLPHEPHVNTAGYDFYNCKSFDPFIATLNLEERNQFTEIFILKFKGVMPELPDYEVGGDNKEFFRKLFIYLGQYRDRIPSDLLGKMYQFSLKI